MPLKSLESGFLNLFALCFVAPIGTDMPCFASAWSKVLAVADKGSGLIGCFSKATLKGICTCSLQNVDNRMLLDSLMHLFFGVSCDHLDELIETALKEDG